MKTRGTIESGQRNLAARLTLSLLKAMSLSNWSKGFLLPPSDPKIPTPDIQNPHAAFILPRPVRSPAQSTGLQPCVPVPANHAACKVARDFSIFIPRGAPLCVAWGSVQTSPPLPHCSKTRHKFKPVQANSALFAPLFFLTTRHLMFMAPSAPPQKKSARELRQRWSSCRCCLPALAGFACLQSIVPGGIRNIRWKKHIGKGKTFINALANGKTGEIELCPQTRRLPLGPIPCVTPVPSIPRPTHLFPTS